MNSHSSPRDIDTHYQPERAHGIIIKDNAEEIWGWASPAGQQRATRRAKLLRSCSRLKPGQTVLELGCGTGLFSREIIADGLHLTSIDISPELLHIAKRKVPDLEFVQTDAHRLPFAESTFDVVLGSSVLHHLEVGLVLREIRRVTRPGGRIAFAEPNMMNPQILLQKNIPPLKKWLGDSPDETAFFRWSLARQLYKEGYTDVKIFPYDFLHPFVPEFAIDAVSLIGSTLERIPLIREIAGSLMISATSPQ